MTRSRCQFWAKFGLDACPDPPSDNETGRPRAVWRFRPYPDAAASAQFMIILHCIRHPQGAVWSVHLQRRNRQERHMKEGAHPTQT